MAESPFELNEAHSGVIVDFLHFARSRRSQCLKSVEMEFQDLIESRLMDDTFTSDEVKEMVSGLCAVVKGEMETELIHASHTHSLLVAQLLQQAEQWHLTMKADISALENKELLEALAQYESHKFNSSPMPTSGAQKAMLAPLEHGAGEKLLQLEISRLEAENAKLQQRLQGVETKVAGALRERDELKKQLQTTPTEATPTSQDEEVTALREAVAVLQRKLSEQATPTSATGDMERELAEKSKELLRVVAELAEVKGELQKKFSETTQYINMRRMLSSKNDQIKELRTQLKKYES